MWTQNILAIQSGGGIGRRYNFKVITKKFEKVSLYGFESCPDYKKKFQGLELNGKMKGL